MPRLDSQQRRLLALLSPTEWRTTEAVYAGTSLFRSAQGVGRALGQFRAMGLIEHRRANNRGHAEWRLLPGWEQLAP